MSNITNYSHVAMSRFNNLHTRSNMHSNMIELVLSVVLFITATIVVITAAVVDKIDKRPILPFTTYDTCSSTSVARSPTSGNIMRRVSLPDVVIQSV